MNTHRMIFFVLLVLGGLVVQVLSPDHRVGHAADSRPVVYVLDVDGGINPALADYIVKGIQTAEENRAAAVIIRLDTPGGMVTTSKTIIKEMMNAKIPVVVFVGPSGSSASSAGAFLTIAADVAVMASGTNIGAAHPVGAGGEDIGQAMAEKVVNDLASYIRGIAAKKGRNADWAEKAVRESVSITAKEALDIKVIDFMAETLDEVQQKIDGRTIEKEGRTLTLQTKGARVERIISGWRFKILNVVASPNIAYILMMIGTLGIMMELYNPGVIFPGVLGSICLLLALFAFQVLPVSYTGLLLIILAVIFFVLELKVLSHGMLSIAGIIALTLGSIMLFESEESALRVSWSVIVPTVATVSAFFVFVLGLVVKAWLSKPRTGEQGIVGEIGQALTDLDMEGKVAVHGEYWNARSDVRIARGERVRVVRVDSLRLLVTRDLGM